ncbi:MAG: class C sortase [Clostridiales bacterium]|nr:class C sortase [Clostridiales bacterium]
MERTQERRKPNKRGGGTTAVLVCVLLLGLAILLYPTVSNWWNNRAASQAVASYDEAVADLTETDYSAYFEAAEAYNEALASIGSASAIADPELVDEDYWDTLDITGTGIMGYITIEKINVELPIYHGTDAGVLQIAAGHLEGTSLPVGGESTHCVISAHRGLPSAMLFTDLDQMEVGDTFTITVLDRVLTYEVDQITIVLPTEAENLYIEEGEDYCTLMTCTPYGVNSHRLLVRGHRIETEETVHIRVIAEATKIDTFLVALALAVPMLAALLLWLLFSTSRRRRRGRREAKTGQNRQ